LYSNISALYIQCFEQPQYYGLKHAIPQHPQGKKNIQTSPLATQMARIFVKTAKGQNLQ